MAKLIGTAGHVDHGKTTLIRALTGIDADRLPEEKKRGLTIDIGFAYIDLPKHGRVSIVDVPGHERFITNMLVGALGIDVALLCISADESVMPQTREHLEILELLPVEYLVVALTRSDLVDDETLELAKAEVEELVAASRFKNAPIMPVSALKGTGLDELKNQLSETLEKTGDIKDGPWYLPVDRVFTVKGHGCVVTGTLAQGKVHTGDRAFLEPGHHEVRVRSIQSHEQSLEESEEGKRTAINLSGIKQEDVRRGMALGAPGALFETSCLDARVRWIAEPKHAQRVRVSLGAEEVIAKLFTNAHEPDLIQLRLENPVACAMDQPVIVRRYSPPTLICGGKVVVPQAKSRRKGEKVKTVSASSSDDAILDAVGDTEQGVPTEEVCRLLGKSAQALGNTFEALMKGGKLKGFAGLWFSPEGYAQGVEKLLTALKDQHEKNPSMAMLPREKVLQAAGLKWSGKPLERILAALSNEGKIVAAGTTLRNPEFSVQLNSRQRELLDRVKQVLDKQSPNTPGAQDMANALHVPVQAIDEILKVGMQAGEIVQIIPGIFYTRAELDRLKEKIVEMAQGKPFTASTFRDAIGTTRKYAIPLLEYFDSVRFTVRVGDQRMLAR